MVVWDLCGTYVGLVWDFKSPETRINTGVWDCGTCGTSKYTLYIESIYTE